MSRSSEQVRVQVTERGPYLVTRGIEIRDAAGEVVGTGGALLCRCGGSQKKPFCDGTHKKIGFTGEETADHGAIAVADVAFKAKATPMVQASKDGPYRVRGAVEVRSSDGEPYECRGDQTLCRCGGSANKPFCDGTHREIGFRDPQLSSISSMGSCGGTDGRP